ARARRRRAEGWPGTPSRNVACILPGMGTRNALAYRARSACARRRTEPLHSIFVPPAVLVPPEPSMSFRLVRCALPLAISVALHAQAPVITKSGDPSIANDSIYRLANQVDADRTHHVTMLLNDVVIRIDANGHGTRTSRQVVYLRDFQGAMRFWRWIFE